MSDELKPCPFCGGEAEISWYARVSSSDAAGYFVECISCSASGEGFDIQGEMPDRIEYTKSKAISAWNTRSGTATFKGHQILAEKIASASHDHGSIAWCAAYDAAKQVADLLRRTPIEGDSQ